MDSTTCGTLGKVLPGSLLGPIVGLTFSTDGGLLFAVSGSTLWVYDVGSGALLSTVRVFMLGVAVYGMDVGRESCELMGYGVCNRFDRRLPVITADERSKSLLFPLCMKTPSQLHYPRYAG